MNEGLVDETLKLYSDIAELEQERDEARKAAQWLWNRDKFRSALNKYPWLEDTHE